MPTIVPRPLLEEFTAGRRQAFRDGTGEPAGGNFLTDLFPASYLLVEAAFGADLAADPATWAWTEITTYFRWDDGIVITIGYQSEDAGNLTPASMTGTINNHQANGGDWTLDNPLSPLWPNVRENTPLRAQAALDHGPSIRFQGYLTTVSPTRDAGGLRIVKLQANGVSRRIGKRGAALSPMTRWHLLSYKYPTSTNAGWPDSDQGYHGLPLHLWALEEGSGAVQAVNAIDPAVPLVADGPDRVPSFGGGGTLKGFAGLCSFNDGTAIGATFPTLITPGGTIESDDNPACTGIRFQFLVQVDESTQKTLVDRLAPSSDTTTTRVLTLRVQGGSIETVVIYFDADATDGLLMYGNVLDSKGVSVAVGGIPMGGEVGIAWERGVYVTVDLVQRETGNIEVRMGHLQLQTSPTDAFPYITTLLEYFSLTVLSTTLKGVNALTLSEFATLGGASVGQLSVYNGATGTFPERYPHALLARTGDTVAERLYRLGVEEGVQIDIIGDATDIPMGPQGTATLPALLQECMEVDLGLLVDGLGPGYTYIARSQLYSQEVGLQFNAGAGDMLGPDEPLHDVDSRANTYTATSAAGQQTFTQPDGDLGTDAIGTVALSGEHPAAFGGDLYQIAAFQVGKGTVGGLRYPRFRFQLAKRITSAQAQTWNETLPGRRLDLIGAEPELPQPDRSLLLLGWSEALRRGFWEVTTNNVRYAPYAVSILAADTGTVSDFLGWLDTDGSVTVGVTPAGAVDATDFESGTTESWTATGATPGITSSTSHSGAWCMTGVVTGAPAQAILRSPNVPVTPGVLYGASMWLQSPGGYANTLAAIDWFDALGGYISTSVGTTAALPAGAWALYTVSGTAPANAATAQYGPTLASSPPNGTGVKVDDALLGAALTISTPTGPVLTNTAVSTYADDLKGLYVLVSGLPLQVLAITGTTSPQVMIVDPTGLLKPIPDGSAVAALNPALLGL